MVERTPITSAWPTAMIRNPHLLAMVLLLILVAGLSAWHTLPRIEDPRITTRNATIITSFPGASAARVEALVSKPIEDELRELSEIKTIESTSRGSVSVVAIELQDWVGPDDNERIFAKVRDRLSEVRLPDQAGRPDFDDKRGAVAYSLILALTWQGPEDAPLGTVNRVAEQLGDRLRGIAGSDQVVYFGAPREEILVDVDPAELAALGMTPAQLAQRVADADAKLPAGALRSSQRNLKVEIHGELDTVQRVAAVPVSADDSGNLLQLEDIARVRKGWTDPPDQIALHDGERAVLIAVRTIADIRLNRWTEQALQRIDEFRTDLDERIVVDTVFNQNQYTNSRLSELGTTLVAGAAVIVFIVLLTMGWRRALLVGAALPLSAGVSLFGLSLFGEQIHQMSIFGMIIAIGLLIDNAIVMTDTVSERLRAGRSRIAAVADASRHLVAPLFASTLTTILGFMPVFLLPGNVGDFVGPIAIAVILALIASFTLSMTVIPALVALLAKPDAGHDRRWWRDGLSGRKLLERYQRLLVAALRHPLRTLILTSALPIAGFVFAGQLGMQFFPPAERNQLEIQVQMPVGTSIDKTAARVSEIESAIHEQPDVESLTWVVGASSPPVYYNQLRDYDQDPTYARAVIKTTTPAAARLLEGQLQDVLPSRFPDAQIIVKAFGQGPPIAAPVAFRIVGPDAGRLREYGEQVRALLHEQPDVLATRAAVGASEPKLLLEADESRARLAGLSLGAIANQFQTALDGALGGSVLEDLEELPVRIRYAADARSDIASLATLRLISAQNTGWVPAEALGDLKLKPELAEIHRRNGERVNEILGYLRAGVLPIEVTRAVNARLDSGELDLPPGYRIETAGDSAEQQNAVGQLLTYAPVLGVLMIATLVLTFRSALLATLIGVVAIFSVGLGMLSLWLGGYPLGFNPIIGSAGLIGVAINGSIVVLAAIRANPEGRSGNLDAIVTETLGATRHIVSTTITTVAGFVPLLVFSGGDFWPPLAIVIAGGVGFSILLSLIFTPSAYYLCYGYRGESLVSTRKIAAHLV